MKIWKEDFIFALFIFALLSVFFVQTCSFAENQSTHTKQDKQ